MPDPKYFQVTRRYNGRVDKTTVVQAEDADRAEILGETEIPGHVQYDAVEMTASDLAGYFNQLSKTNKE